MIAIAAAGARRFLAEEILVSAKHPLAASGGRARGDRVLHIGGGSGYFTSLIAHVVGPAGRVDGIDVDAELAVRARVSLSDQPWAHVRHGNGSTAPRHALR